PGHAGVLDRAPEGDMEDRVETRRREPRQPATQQLERQKAVEEARGRSAETPSDIPAKGWKDVLLRVYRGISDDRVLANAAAVTFYALLALFPALAALVSIYGLFADPASIQQHLDAASGVLPGGAVDLIRDQLNRLAAQPRGTLGVSFAIGLVISLWSANGGIKALFDALNVVYEEREERSFIRLNALSLTFTLSMIAFLLVAIAAIVAIPVALNYLPGFIGFVLNIARWPAMLVLVALALACIYRYGPSRTEARWRWLTWGSAFAALAWLGFSAIFSYYAANFGNFNKTYGSLGAVIGFMTWMWLSVAVILVGAKLNAEMEHQTARDSTEKGDKPLGGRGAKMADTVGEAQGS
ncbi:MAG TPA: YihY/virulence factor BrkB family protein, partial [Stellaceae bacterium]